MNTEEGRSRICTICLMILTAAVLTYFIYWLRPVLMPFVVALFIVSGVTPVLERLRTNLGVNQVVAAGLTFLSGLVVLAVLGAALWGSISDMAENSEVYITRVQELVNYVENKLPFLVSSPTPAEDGVEAAQEAHTLESDISLFLEQLARQGLSNVSQAMLQLVSTSVIILIYVFFLLLGESTKVSSGWHEIDLQIRNYIALKSVISLFTGLTFGLALHIFGVPMAITFGVLAFLLNFIPNVGPLIASLLPVPFIILDPEGTLMWMAAVIAVTSGIQIISGNVVEPKLMGTSSDLHPVVILLALMFWGMMWGIIGMFLATPITAGIKIVLERIEATRPVAAMMAGRWKMPESTAEGKVV